MVALRLWTLIVKEMNIIFGDISTLRLLMMPVILQTLLFPFAATLDLKNSTLAIYDQDLSAFSIELSQRLSATEAFPQIITINSDTQLQQVIDTQAALIAIRISKNSTQIQAIMDGRRTNSAQIALSYMSEIVEQMQKERGLNLNLVSLNTHHFYNPNLNFKWFMLPNLVGLIITIGTLIVTALSLAREREEGTFDQLLVSPLTPLYIMIGKAVPAIIVALIQGTIITLMAIFLYQVPFTGTLLLHYLAMLCYTLSLIGFGLFISAISATQQHAFLGVFFFMVPAVVLSGFIAPVENMPPFLYWLAQFNPMSHYMIIVKGIFLKAYTLTDALPHLGALLCIAIIMFYSAYWLFNHKTR